MIGMNENTIIFLTLKTMQDDYVVVAGFHVIDTLVIKFARKHFFEVCSSMNSLNKSILNKTDSFFFGQSSKWDPVLFFEKS